jgi:hypothetical protein
MMISQKKAKKNQRHPSTDHLKKLKAESALNHQMPPTQWSRCGASLVLCNGTGIKALAGSNR